MTSNSARLLQVAKVLDVKGLNCPLPILKTKVAIRGIKPGQILQVLATDPHSVVDFEVYCVRTGHELIQTIKSDHAFEFLIRRTSD